MRARWRCEMELMTAPPGNRAAWAWASLLWLTVGGWLGAWFLFAFGVAPVAFNVLPSAQLAGDLVGPLLRGLHWYGMAAGALAALAAWRMGRGWLLIGLPLVLGAICAYNELVVSAEIVTVRPRDFDATTDPEAAARFAELHRLSRNLYTVVGLGVVGLVLMHARRGAVHPSSEAGPAGIGMP